MGLFSQHKTINQIKMTQPFTNLPPRSIAVLTGPTYRPVKWRSSPRPHSICGSLMGERTAPLLLPKVFVLGLALINKFCSNGENNRRC